MVFIDQENLTWKTRATRLKSLTWFRGGFFIMVSAGNAEAWVQIPNMTHSRESRDQKKP